MKFWNKVFGRKSSRHGGDATARNEKRLQEAGIAESNATNDDGDPTLAKVATTTQAVNGAESLDFLRVGSGSGMDYTKPLVLMDHDMSSNDAEAGSFTSAGPFPVGKPNPDASVADDLAVTKPLRVDAASTTKPIALKPIAVDAAQGDDAAVATVKEESPAAAVEDQLLQPAEMGSMRRGGEFAAPMPKPIPVDGGFDGWGSDSLEANQWSFDGLQGDNAFAVSDRRLQLDGQVQSLVDAMAGFSPTAVGDTKSRANESLSLERTIAVDWQ